MSIAGEKVLVTGASGGLGPAVVRAFLAAGAKVIGAARGAPGLEALSQSLGRPPALTTVAADLSTAAGAEAAAQEQPFAFVHAVGAWAGGAPLVGAPDAELDQMLDANFRSAWFCARAAMRHMVAAGRGRIVLVGSMGGLHGSPRSAAYGASKAAVLSLVASLAAEGRSHGVACNAVAPGTIDTAANRRAMPKADTKAWVMPEEVAAAILFLASPEATGVSGAIVPVSRGG
jgi:NAD(P)-dependent dehydrogenase (short-subunit alcohol dehydrogenase family)